jgi:hypothetical protein
VAHDELAPRDGDIGFFRGDGEMAAPGRRAHRRASGQAGMEVITKPFAMADLGARSAN